jgi:hypothetical protein
MSTSKLLIFCGIVVLLLVAWFGFAYAGTSLPAADVVVSAQSYAPGSSGAGAAVIPVWSKKGGGVRFYGGGYLGWPGYYGWPGTMGYSESVPDSSYTSSRNNYSDPNTKCVWNGYEYRCYQFGQ